ncbi:MAG: hypothetical protein JKX73_03760 [Flavobacteriales bacterium]|nr:hypothetical protein [Flavobacteriales bacterium]
MPEEGEELLTIRTFTYDHESLAYESRLEAEGIFYLMKDQMTTTIDPLLSNAIGGIRLQILKRDVDQVAAILNEIDKYKREIEEESEIIFEGKKFEKTMEECPECGKENIFMESYTLWKSLMNTFSKRTHYCDDCEHQWKQA